MDKTVYLDIMEKSLSAYTEQRIRDYIDEVKRDGLREHGFARLGVNIGILISYGRRCELKDTFIEIMDICCDQMPRVKAANDFSIREVCCCLSLCREKQTVDSALIDKWISLISTFNPWTRQNDTKYFLNLISREDLSLTKMITHKASYKDAENTYKMLKEDKANALAVHFYWED